MKTDNLTPEEFEVSYNLKCSNLAEVYYVTILDGNLLFGRKKLAYSKAGLCKMYATDHIRNMASNFLREKNNGKWSNHLNTELYNLDFKKIRTYLEETGRLKYITIKEYQNLRI